MKYFVFLRCKGTPVIYLFKPIAQLFEKQLVCFSAVKFLTQQFNVLFDSCFRRFRSRCCIQLFLI